MNLVNRVLLDLEARANIPLPDSSPNSLIADLHPVSKPKATILRQKTIAGLASAILAAAIFLLSQLPVNLQSDRVAIAVESLTPDKMFIKQDMITVTQQETPVTTTTASLVKPTVPTIKESITKEDIIESIPMAPKMEIAKKIILPSSEISRTEARSERKPPASSVRLDNSDTTSSNSSTKITRKKHQPSRIDKAHNAYNEGIRLVNTGRITEAEQYFLNALSFDPMHTRARESLVGLLVRFERWDEAQLILQSGLGLMPSNKVFIQWLARIYVQQGTDNRALTLLERGFASSGDDPEYLAFLATVYQRVNRDQDAIVAFRQALDKRPNEGKWWIGLAMSLEKTSDWSAAYKAYGRALDSNKQDPSLASYARQRQGGIAALMN